MATDNKAIRDLMDALEKTPYVQWIRKEGPPVVECYAVEDVRDIALGPWPRIGGKGAFIQLYGMEGVTGMYVAEIPSGGALEPERHFYEEVICILDGQGATEVWQEGGRRQMFEWGPWSLFAPPLNSWHRLINGGREPVRFVAVTNAPITMDMYHNLDFVFNCPYQFSDRYEAEEDYFNVGTKRYKKGLMNLWETNFIPNVKDVGVDEQKVKGSGLKLTQFEISGNALMGHVADWPTGRYQKAHYHGAGAILLILQSHGYVLLWPKESGTQPYKNGRGGDVVEVEWKEGSLYCPPAGWFHQHFNTGDVPARQVAFRYGTSRLNPIGYRLAERRKGEGTLIDIKDGGTLIGYEDEDPEIRRRFEAELRKGGIPCQMPDFLAKSA